MTQATNEKAPNEQPIADIKINKLAYRLLGVLSRKPSTGYDIVKALEKFRPVQISQVYPLLTEMESLGLLTSKEVIQSGKPNKKIYQPTHLADEVIRGWIRSETAEPLQRDDFVAKVYSLWKGLPEERVQLIQQRLIWLESEVTYFTDCVHELHGLHGELVSDPNTWQFCRDVLMARRLVLYNEEILWCHRVLHKLKLNTDKGDHHA